LFKLTIVVLTTVSLLAGGCSPATPTQPPPTATQPPATPTTGPLDLVKAYEEAFNRHDVEAVMALVSDNIWIDLVNWPSDQSHSRQESHDLLESWFALNVEFHHTDCKTTGSSVVGCKAVASLDCSKAAGMSGINFLAVTFDLHNSKIDQITLQMQPDDENTYSSFLNNMEQWANRVHPEEMKKVTVTNGEMGAIYGGLCKEYAAINH
jgi:hypothetical protein